MKNNNQYDKRVMITGTSSVFNAAGSSPASLDPGFWYSNSQRVLLSTKPGHLFSDFYWTLDCADPVKIIYIVQVPSSLVNILSFLFSFQTPKNGEYEVNVIAVTLRNVALLLFMADNSS